MNYGYNYGFSFLESISNLLAVPVLALKAIVILFMAFTLFCIYKSWNKGHNKELMNALILSSVMLILINIFSFVFLRFMGYYVGLADGGAPTLALIVTIIIYVVGNSNGNKIYPDGYFDNISNSEFLKTEISNSINYLINSLKKEGRNFENNAFNGDTERYRKGNYEGDNYNRRNYENNYDENSNHRKAYNAYGYGPNIGPAPFRGYVKDNWSYGMYILLSIITCGLYQWYFLYKASESLNIVCNGDGDETPGLLRFIVFGVITCGIYCLFWEFNFMNRIAANGPRYGRYIQDNGGTFLLWIIIGAWLCGIGPFVAWYLFMKNLNIICRAYNMEYAGQY